MRWHNLAILGVLVFAGAGWLWLSLRASATAGMYKRLLILGGHIEALGFESRSIVSRDLADVIHEIRARRPGVSAFGLSERDIWGKPIVFTVDVERGIVTLRSLGPNGVDDAGADDDIQVTVWLSTHTQSDRPWPQSRASMHQHSAGEQ
jgi:hypothetical protein